jgi:hypothetical protein
MQASNLEVVPKPSTDLGATIAALAPANPFYTNAYISYRRALGYEPYLLMVREQGKLIAGCTAFCRSGRLSRSLEITSLPYLNDRESFWTGLWGFCSQIGVTQLVVCTFASPAGEIPALQDECWRKPRVEYTLGLVGPDLWKHIRKGHLWNIKQGRKAGLTVKESTDHEACVAHAQLIEASMNRRINRGEEVSVPAKAADYWPLVQSGAGKLFQALYRDHVVSSNLVLLSKIGAYNHSQGTNPEGMEMGAAHFLIYEIANALRDQSFEVFNLGGTDQLKSGLERSKDGFGATTTKVELESAAFSLENRFVRLLKSAVRFVFVRFPPRAL